MVHDVYAPICVCTKPTVARTRTAMNARRSSPLLSGCGWVMRWNERAADKEKRESSITT